MNTMTIGKSDVENLVAPEQSKLLDELESGVADELFDSNDSECPAPSELEKSSSSGLKFLDSCDFITGI